MGWNVWVDALNGGSQTLAKYHFIITVTFRTVAIGGNVRGVDVAIAIAVPQFGMDERSRQHFLVGIARNMEAVAVIFYDSFVAQLKHRAFFGDLSFGQVRFV
jgi:hypothetical protein